MNGLTLLPICSERDSHQRETNFVYRDNASAQEIIRFGYIIFSALVAL
ncbi:unnamed protein product [Tenebrio molitor]|nr:unnamed protein product [Tenebrio molitor]